MITKEMNKHVLSLKNDVLFKRVYGSDTEESKFILKSLLNKILGRDDDPIVHIEYKNPFSIKECVDEKESVLDIKAETNKRELIDIEMQILWDKDMPSRLLYYHGGLLRESLQRGEDYDKMKQTITICIIASGGFKENDSFLSEFLFIEKDKRFIFSDKTKICCIELSKVNPDNKKAEDLSPLEMCLEYLRCADENGSEYVDELIRRGGKDLEMTQEILRKATEEEILRERALAREKFLRDKLHMENRYNRGLEEGREEGRMTERRELAKNFRNSGIPIDVIAKNTGLTIEEIEKL